MSSPEWRPATEMPVKPATPRKFGVRALPPAHATWDPNGDFRDLVGDLCDCELCEDVRIENHSIEVPASTRYPKP